MTIFLTIILSFLFGYIVRQIQLVKTLRETRKHELDYIKATMIQVVLKVKDKSNSEPVNKVIDKAMDEIKDAYF